MDVASISENNVNEERIEEITIDGGHHASRNFPTIETPGDMFAQKEVDDLLPASMKSRTPKLKSRLKAHAEWASEDQYNNTFLHMQSHTVDDGNNKFRISQDQYYNHHHEGPSFKNPKYTRIRVIGIEGEEENNLGLYNVDTDALMQDIKSLRDKGMITNRSM